VEGGAAHDAAGDAGRGVRTDAGAARDEVARATTGDAATA
jgi:hypothetical protein